MAAVNTKAAKRKAQMPLKTFEGAPAKAPASTLMELRKAVASCMLWEDQFYESGVDIATRIKDLVHALPIQDVLDLAVEARTKMKLRHVPLLLMREAARHKDHKTGRVGDALANVIQRADELTEFLAIYWKEGKTPVSKQVKVGLGNAFKKFNEYSLAKYNRDGAVKLRDVLFLTHPKPNDSEQEALWKRLVDGTMTTPDTWETVLSSGADKKESWNRLLSEGKLGPLALLRNIRNMKEAGVDELEIGAAIKNMKTERVLPFRFIAASRYAPSLVPQLETAMFKCLEGHEKLSGHTIILIDVSGSMDDRMSDKSDLTRVDAACGLAMLAREVCESCSILTFSANTVVVPTYRGFALGEAINKSQPHLSTMLGDAVAHVNKMKADRIIVITDEQSRDVVPGPTAKKAYMVNVASYRNEVGYGPWNRVSGWSESIIDYIVESEKL